jgi:hypothetical protein
MPQRYGFSNTTKLHKVQYGGRHHSQCGLAYLEDPLDSLSHPEEFYDRCGKCFPDATTIKEVKTKQADPDFVNWCIRVGLTV